MGKQPFHAAISRRQVLKAGVATAAASAFGFPGLIGRAQADALIIINLADTHSAYDAYPRLVTMVERILQDNPDTPAVILFNGDLFELGSVVARRSLGEVDWAFAEALQTLAPLVINIGNHEFDFLTPDDFMLEAGRRDITVVGNVLDSLSTRLISPAFTTIPGVADSLGLVGVATDALNTYEESVRPQLAIPDPVSWVRDNYAHFTESSDWSVLLTHAGVAADREMLSALPEDVLIVGGHNHLTFKERFEGGAAYVQNGFRGERLQVVKVTLQGERASFSFEDHLLDETVPAHAALAALVEEVRETYLESDDRAIIGVVDRDYTVLEAARWAVETLRRETGADVAMLNHTSFGAGLRAGPLPRHRFDEFLRFDNDVMRAEVDGDTLRSILAIANQGPDTPLEARTGDFVYATELRPDPDETYTVVSSSWVALPFNLQGYLGTEEITFEQIEGVTTKGILAEVLSRDDG